MFLDELVHSRASNVLHSFLMIDVLSVLVVRVMIGNLVDVLFLTLFIVLFVAVPVVTAFVLPSGA